jgi:hypothetical protein
MAGNDINLPNLVSHLQVNLQDTSGLVAEATRQGSSVGAALGQSLSERVRRAVDEIPDVEIDGNSTQLDRDLDRVRRELLELANTRIGVDISVEEALRRLNELEPHLDRIEHEHPTMNVAVSVGGARADLREILDEAHRVDDTDVTVDVHTNTARASADLRDAGRAASGLTGALSGVGAALGPLAAIGGLAGAAIPAVAGLVATLQQIAPAAAVGASGALAIGSAFGAVKLGTSGIGDAITAAFAPVTGGGGGGGGGGAAKAAAAATLAFADAQRNLRDAIQQAAYANQQATRGVVSAQRDLGDALKAARQAQLDLLAAQKQAARSLEDQNNQLIDARNDEKQAVLDVTDAQANLNAVNKVGSKATAEDREKAQLQLDKAKQALAEQSLAVQRLQADTDAANKAGVSGSTLVQDAQQKVADTARDVSDRQQAVADAQTNVQRTAAAGAESIDKAREALQQAAQAADDGSGGGAAGAVDAFAAAMAKLSPAAQAFVREVIKLRPAFDSLKLDVQEHLFAGLAEVLDSTARALLPVLRKSLDDSATSLNGMAVGVAAAARSLADSGVLGQALSGANRGLANLVPLPAQFVDALIKLAAAASPAFDRVTLAISRSAATLSTKLDRAFASGELEKSIDFAIDLIGEIGGVIANLGRILTNIFAPAVASGDNFIGVLRSITGQLAKATNAQGFQDAMAALFGVIGEIGRVVGPLLLQALAALEPVLIRLQGPATDLVDVLGAGLSQTIAALEPLLATAATGVGDLVEAALPLIPVAADIVTGLGDALMPILDELVNVFVDLRPTVQQVADTLSVALAPVLADLPLIVGPLADLVARNLVVALQGLSVILDKNGPQLAQLGLDLGNLLVALGPLILAFTEFTTKALVKLSPLLIAALDAATRFATYMSGTFSGVINNVVIRRAAHPDRPAVRALRRRLAGGQGPHLRRHQLHPPCNHRPARLGRRRTRPAGVPPRREGIGRGQPADGPHRRRRQLGRRVGRRPARPGRTRPRRPRRPALPRR